MIINSKKNQNGGDAIPKSDSSTELKAIFTEHWKHARHRENERLWFTNIYAVVVAAILVFMGETRSSQPVDFGPTLVLAIFGLILSLIGFMVVISLSLGYLHHITDIVMIFYYWDKMEFYRHPGKPIRFVNVHRWFYEITIAFFGVLSLYYASQAWTSLAVFCSYPTLPTVTSIIFVTIEVFYQLIWGKYFRKCHYFRETLRNDTERCYWKDWDKWFKDPDFQRKIIEDAKERNKKKTN